VLFSRRRHRPLLVNNSAENISLLPGLKSWDHYTLTEFLDEAQRVINVGQAEWTVSQDAPFDDEDVPYRLNPLLALKLHLEWLASIFRDQPGVSVSVR
jgi:hypothetical protein